MAAARVEIPLVILSEESPTSPVAGATIAIKNRKTEELVTVYANSGASEATIAQPLTSNSAGMVTGWLPRGAYSAEITVSGKTPYTEYFDIAPGSDGSIESSWLGNGSVTREKLAESAKPFSQTIGNGSSKEFTITHNFGTRNIWPVVRQAASPWKTIWAGFTAEAATTNTVVLKFETAPTSNQYTVTVFA